MFHCVFSCVTAKPGGRIRCQYVPTVDKVLFVDDYAVGCRKDLNGILLLDTALQPPVAKAEDLVHLELPVTEVRRRCEVLGPFSVILWVRPASSPPGPAGGPLENQT